MRRLRADPHVAALTALVCAAALVLAVAPVPTTAQAWVTWVTFGVLHAVLLRAAWLVRQSGGIPGPARRLWTGVAVAGGAFLVGDVAQGFALATDPQSPSSVTGSSVQTALLLVGLVALLLPALLEPVRLATTALRRKFWLDVGVVFAAFSAVGGYVFGQETSGTSTLVAAVLLGPALFAIGTFALLKLQGLAERPFGVITGRILTLAAVGEVALAFVQRPMTESGLTRWFLVASLVPNALLVLAARVEGVRHRAGWRGTSTPPPGDGSVLSFLAPLATNALLVFVLVTEGLTPRAWFVIAWTVIGTVLVVTRQLVALEEKAQLAEALDTRVGELDRALAERDALHHRLRHLAFHDSLTGVANRASFDEHLAAALRSPAELWAGPPTVVYIDLDGFKGVNDDHGHECGDALLVAVARRLAASLREGDVVARLGGDEFCLLLHSAPQDVPNLAQRVVDALSQPFQLDAATVCVGASVGVATGSADTTGADLLRRADAAMYRAKRLGKGRYVVDVDVEAPPLAG